MKRFIFLGAAAAAIAIAPIASAQSLGVERERLRVLGEAHEEACSAANISEDGVRRCRESKGRLMDLRARVAMVNTSLLIDGFRGKTAATAADIAALRQDVQTYAAFQPTTLEDLSLDLGPIEGEEEAEAEAE